MILASGSLFPSIFINKSLTLFAVKSLSEQFLSCVILGLDSDSETATQFG